MKPRCTATMWEANSSDPATAKHSTPFSPTIASRCFCRSSRGWPSRQASRNSSAQPTASAHSSSRITPSAAVLLASQKISPCHTRPRRITATRTPQHASQTRSASRPTARRPATSCAEPGTSKVMITSVIARRKRTRESATSWELPYGTVRAAEAPDPEEETGGMSGPFECCSRGARLTATVQYHQSHPSQAGRRAGAGSAVGRAAGDDLGLPREPVRPPDLGLPHPPALGGGLRSQPRDEAWTAGILDRDEHQVRRRHVQRFPPGLVPRLALDADADLHRRTPRPVDLGHGADDVADLHRLEEGHVVHRRGDRRTAAVWLRDRDVRACDGGSSSGADMTCKVASAPWRTAPGATRTTRTLPTTTGCTAPGAAASATRSRP